MMPDQKDDSPWGSAQDAQTRVRIRRGSGKYARSGTAMDLLVDIARARSVAETEPLLAMLDGFDEDLQPLEKLIDALRERAEAFDAQRLLAGSDELTGIANRRSFNEVLSREVSRCRRSGRPLSLLLLDVDGLKCINDKHGHLAGDEAIVAVSRACTASLRGSDVVARLGGDEFAVVLPETSEEQAVVVRRRIRRKLAMEPGSHASLGISIGGSVMLEPDMDARTLMSVADDALYEDKRVRKSNAPPKL